MTKILRRIALAVSFLLVLAAPARAADPETAFFDYYCSMGSFQICASVRLYSVGNQLTMEVWNLEGALGDSHTMTSIGLYHSGAASGSPTGEYSWDVFYNGETIKSFWTDQGANDIKTLGGVWLELKAGTSGNNGIAGCDVPPSGTKWSTCFQNENSFPEDPRVTFVFDFQSHFSLADVELRWHSQQLPDGSSIKCDTGGYGDYPECIPNTTIPEPATIVLLGTGIAGLAGVARRRRKRETTPSAPSVDLTPLA